MVESKGIEEAFEAWPALVDVWAAAFVFVLLVFFALLTRDLMRLRSQGANLARASVCAQVKAVHDIEVQAWEKSIVREQDATVANFLESLEKHLYAFTPSLPNWLKS